MAGFSTGLYFVRGLMSSPVSDDKAYVRKAHITSAKSLVAGVQGPSAGPGRFRVLDALWCYLSPIFNKMTIMIDL